MSGKLYSQNFLHKNPDLPSFPIQCVRFRPSNCVMSIAGHEQMKKKPTELLSVSSEGLLQHWNV